MPIVRDLIIPDVTHVKYPDWKDWPLSKQVQVYVDEAVENCGKLSIEVFLMTLGVSAKDYIAITNDSTYPKMMEEKSKNRKFIGRLPEFFEKLGDLGAEGDLNAIKLGMLSVADKDSALANPNLGAMDDKALVREIAQLMVTAKELGIATDE